MSHIQTLFTSYDEALSNCGDGYNSDDIAQVVAIKTKSFKDFQNKATINPDPTAVINAISYLTAAQTHGRACRIVDLGGASGYHYLCAKSVLESTAHLWTVVETASMVRAAKPLLETETLRFVSELEEAIEGRVDLLICSGALQYMPQPEATLERICAAKPQRIILARMPAYQGPRIVGLQQSQLSHNGPGLMPAGIQDRVIQHPITFVPGTVLSSYLTEYRIMQRYDSPSANYVVGQTRIAGVTLVLERK